MAGASVWLKAVHRLERAIGERVEAAVHSDGYFDFVAIAQRQQRQAQALAEGLSRRCLHMLNLPAGSDVRRLREQLARMDRRLTRLAKELEGGVRRESAEAAGPSDGRDTADVAEADGSR
jgi:hypothetical protein